ncbi:ADP-ribosylation factor family protein [Mariprofundus micogutta]|uniref:ADP-ribosylation factor family protein n=1 Tax=Mariprofundus micogutta TaxID=1921010 RepID=A0A1L8CPW5_9PROT|nr:ATP/GTP-binding protein [Mariprofundus micogutta]GAV20976.1 ADP-ribosylation factor family protein [Mariprofundus micogutta]
MGSKVVKLVVTGPVNAGKTTLIRGLSDVPVVCTNEMATDVVSEVKEGTTVAMDHGICYPSEDLELHLYGTPGQRRFDFMWEILAVGANGVLFLVDGSDETSLEELKYIYNHFGERTTLGRLVAVTRQDVSGAVQSEDLAAMLGISSDDVFGLDARSCDHIKPLLLSRFSDTE